MPTWLTHGWQAWFTPPFASQLLLGAGLAREGVQDSMSTPHPQHGQGVTLSVPLPYWGGSPQNQQITSYWQGWSWERSWESSLGPTAAWPKGSSQGIFSLEGHPPWGP